ncbi:MAG: ABC transporter permease [Vallitalea sp.]|jgi:ABC-type antimicrobial peptide transport system permease subunit|nr:ABC transporter permease [Vallitalea sp.]
MNSLDLIRMGLKNLFRRKLRTFLTTLGIIIGTISIIVMISIGIGMQKNMDDRLNKMGSLDIIEVYPSREGGGGGGNHREMSVMSSSNRSSKENLITNNDITLLKQIEGIDAVTPVIEMDVTMASKRMIGEYVEIKGMTLEFMEKYGLEIDKGRMLASDDKNALLMGKYILHDFHDSKDENWWENMYDPETGERKAPVFDPIGEKMTMSFDRRYGRDDSRQPIRPTKVSVVGTLSNDNYHKAGYAYMEISKLQELKEKYDKMTAYAEYDGKKPRNTGYRQALVHVPNRKDIEDIQKEIGKLGLDARSDSDWLKESESMASTVKMVFGGIGGIALLVAAIGITNTMVMAIYERRKEIGVMKVIGSSIRDIKKLFLFESAAIGLLGGLLGILASFGLSYALNNLISDQLMHFLDIYPDPDEAKIALSIIPPWLVFSALGFTALIGLVSGYLPARKAMKLSALEAIKTD